MVSEKVGGAEGTKLDDDFRDLERVREASFCGHKRKTSLTKAVCLVGFTQYTNLTAVLTSQPHSQSVPVCSLAFVFH